MPAIEQSQVVTAVCNPMHGLLNISSLKILDLFIQINEKTLVI